MVLLAGGTGGAKLARGMLDEVGSHLVVIANTGDDVEVHGGYVSPDPDLVLYWLADRIDERGWGLRDDTFAVMDALRELGEEVWFNLGDRDLAVCLQRARRLGEGARLTETLEELRAGARRAGARCCRRPTTPIRTHVRARGEWFGFQEFMIREGAQGPVEGVEVLGAGSAQATPGGARGDRTGAGDRDRAVEPGDLDRADPRGRRDRRRAAGDRGAGRRGLAARARRGAQGPDRHLHGSGPGIRCRPTGSCAHYAGLIDGLVSDERASGVPTLETDVEMGDADARRRVARETLEFAAALRG